MNHNFTYKRASGILAHISSLPSPYGIGDIGFSSYRFIDFLKTSGQGYWQILPTNPTSQIFDNSPYMSVSAFAGSPLLISPELIAERGWLDESELKQPEHVSPHLTNYTAVTQYKEELLRTAFKRFSLDMNDEYIDFCGATSWLDDYALFMTLKSVFKGNPWSLWPNDLAKHHPTSLTKAKNQFPRLFEYYRFEQFVFFSQWSLLKSYAQKNNIRLIGDIPIYIGLDSADVWANQDLFELDPATRNPLRVSGVPPDYFSRKGQHWGNPLYRWNSKDPLIRQNLLEWWIDRFSAVFDQVDCARIDHFRGFESFWAIPDGEKTAINGTWVKGPGSAFFKKIQKRIGPLDIIAEDLGEITEKVIKLRETTGYPGMKVLQFGFDGNPDNPFLPHNYTTSNCVVYTGTHDNDTTLGWYLSSHLDDPLRSKVKKMANRVHGDASPIHEDMIYLAYSSIASLAIIPLQDLLGFGSDCRMNIPGVAAGNWKWRCSAEFLTEERASWLKTMTERFGR